MCGCAATVARTHAPQRRQRVMRAQSRVAAPWARCHATQPLELGARVLQGTRDGVNKVIHPQVLEARFCRR
jgi:hypothetical protein